VRAVGANTLLDVMGAVSALEFGVRRDGWGDDACALSAALQTIAVRSKYPNGTLYLPPGTYNLESVIAGVSNVEIIGAGAATVLRLNTGKNCNVLNLDGLSNVRISRLKINGNRASNTSGNGLGIYINNCQDCWFDAVEVVSCRQDAFQLNGSSRIHFHNCKTSDNGRHGFSLNTADFCELGMVESYDNSQVESAGTGDGISLDTLSHDNVIIGAHAYETSLAGVRQGYGIREVSGGGCYRNLVIGGSFQGNKTGQVLLEPDSLWLAYNSLYTGGLGVNTASPNASALLDLTSTRLGLLPPRLTTIQKNNIASPATGLVVYDTTLNKLCVYTGAAWEAVTSA